MRMCQRIVQSDPCALATAFLLGAACAWVLLTPGNAWEAQVNIAREVPKSMSEHSLNTTSGTLAVVRSWLRAQFNLMDQDADGLVDKHDVKRANQTLHLRSSYVNKLQGVVGNDEMSFDTLAGAKGWLHTQFHMLDSDKDGLLADHDLSQIMRLSRKMDLQPSYAKKIRNHVRDHEMNFDEFISNLKQLELAAARSKDGALADAEVSQSIFEESISRATLLLCLMILQSGSAMVLGRYEALLKDHMVVMLFLTMLVGAGGNVGNQSVIKVIEELISGQLALTTAACTEALLQQLAVGGLLALLLGAGGFLRAFVSQYYFRQPGADKRRALKGCLAVTVALMVIVLTSAVLGTLMPLTLAVIGLDVAHAGPSIQVVMDIGGVVITCSIARWILEPRKKQVAEST